MGTRLISTVQQGELEFITCFRPAPGILGALDWSQEDKQPEREFIERKPPQRPDTQRSDVDRRLAIISHQVLLGSPCGNNTEMPRSRTSTDKHCLWTGGPGRMF